MKRLLAITFLLAFVLSCSKTDGKGGYAVKIDGTKITKQEIQTEISALPEVAREFYKGPEGTERLINELVNREMLYMEAKKKGFEKTPEFKKKLEDFKKVTLIQQMLGKEMEGWSKVTDEDVKAYYDKNKADMIEPTKIRLSHIVVNNEQDAIKAAERLKKGEDFAKVAAEMSTDTKSAKSGGDLGSFNLGELDPNLENIAFRLKKGDISVPLKRKDGIHLLKVTERQGKLVPFDKAKDVIKQKLTAEKQKEGFDKYLEGIKKNYKVDINRDEISSINFAAQPEKKPEQKAAEPAKK
ncbi:MAG: peptidyl-prolyl cis-trans isomerase [Nitrospiraceae bacterium]|nr:peptidyl-prolyl cis-trans isomerase [Nitrospiraceae bacterium]